MRPRLRRTLRVSLLLLVAAAVNVAVAWVCVARTDLTGGFRVIDVAEVDSWPRWVPADWPLWRETIEACGSAMAAEVVDHYGSGVTLRRQWLGVTPPPGSGPPEMTAAYIRIDQVLGGGTWRAYRLTAGWPLECMVAEWAWVAPTGADRQQEIRAPGPRGGWHVGPDLGGELPLMPLWPGFAVNTFAFALAFAAPWFAIGRWTRRRRARRGLCTGCGYELAGIAADRPCPECGAAPVLRPVARDRAMRPERASR